MLPGAFRFSFYLCKFCSQFSPRHPTPRSSGSGNLHWPSALPDKQSRLNKDETGTSWYLSAYLRWVCSPQTFLAPEFSSSSSSEGAQGSLSWIFSAEWLEQPENSTNHSSQCLLWALFLSSHPSFVLGLLLLGSMCSCSGFSPFVLNIQEC